MGVLIGWTGGAMLEAGLVRTAVLAPPGFSTGTISEASLARRSLGADAACGDAVAAGTYAELSVLAAASRFAEDGVG